MLETVHLDPHASRTEVRSFLHELAVLARRHRELELELALLLAWFKRQDPAALGYSSFTAFARENVDWRTSWLRDMIRLAESPLDLVKQAVREGLLPLRIAVGALGRVDVDGQRAWLADVVLNPEAPEVPRVLDEFAGDDAEVICNARRLARLCVGRVASEREIDDYILACWRDRIPAEVIVARAHEPPPPPPPALPLSWTWIHGPLEPASIGEARSRLDRLQAVLRGRQTVLARAWAGVVDDHLWCEGYESVQNAAQDVLGMSGRQAQRIAKLGRTLDLWPEIEDAIRRGLAIGAAEQIGIVVGENDVADWLAIAERVGRLELARGVADARERGSSRSTIVAYAAAIGRADRWATSAGAPPRVAIAHPETGHVARPVRAPRELLEAARWFCATVVLPAQHGFGRVKERDAFRCQNPECGRMSLRNEAHHLVFRSQGGTDVLENGVTLCRCCHLRGVHANLLAVERQTLEGASVLVWRWPDGRRVLAFQAAGD